MKEKKTVKQLGKSFLARQEVPVLAATLIMAVIFAIFNSNFFSAYNIFNLSRTAALYMFVALSQTVVMIVGGMNVSLGFIGALCCVAAGTAMQDWGWGTVPAMLFALVVGIACGLVNGLIITKLKLNSFIATLATQFIYKGLVTGISGGFPYTKLTDNFTVLGRGNFLGLPYMLFLAVAVLVVVWFVFRFTVLGRKLLATGGNKKAAQMAAVNTDRMELIANILSGLFAAMAAICTVSMNGSAQPSTGADWMIYSFAVSVIGGTALAGGAIRPLGLFIGGFMIVMIKNGLVMLDANVYYEQTYLGLILLVAVSLGSVSTMIGEARRKAKFRKSQRK